MEWIKLKAMSFSLNKIRNELMDSRANQFAEHACKIIESKDMKNISHWAKELFSFCSWIMQAKLKKDNKRVSKDLIMQYFFGYCDDIESFVSTLNYVYSLYYGDIKNRDTIKDLKKFNNYRILCDKTAELLSKGSMVLEDMIKLINQYLVN